jgi:peptide/nickel transport system substrate-binding protein
VQALIRVCAGALALLALTVLVAACGSSDEDGGGGGSGGASNSASIRIGMADEISTVNPFTAMTFAEGKAIQQIYPDLVNFDANGEPVPSFATSWEVSPDAKTLTLRTQPNARWSDGEPLTAEDVAFTIDLVLRYKDGATASMSGPLALVTSVEAPDENTVVLQYSEPTATAVPDLAALPILAEHVWSRHIGRDGDGLSQFKNTDPNVSGGPYILDSLTPKQSARFVVNPEWYGDRPQNGGFTALTFRNPDALINGIKTSQVDLVDRPPLTSFNLFEEAAGVTTETAPGFEKLVAQVNTNPDKLRNHALLDPRVRKALSLAMDRELVANDVYHGAFEADGSVIGPYSPYHVDVGETLYDLDAANTLLDEAGMRAGDDEIRSTADGERLSFEVVSLSTNPGAGRVFDMMRENAAEIGIELKLKALDPNAAFAFQASPDNKYLHYDMLLNTTSNGFDPNATLRAMTCLALDSFNPTRYCNRRYDELYVQQSVETDEAKRKQIVGEMQRLLYEEGPEIVIGYADGTAVYRDNWSGFQVLADGAWSSLGTSGLIGAQPAG